MSCPNQKVVVKVDDVVDIKNKSESGEVPGPSNSKKRKVNREITNDHDNDFEKLIDSKWIIKSVLSDETTNIELCEIVVTNVLKRQESGNLLKKLPQLPKELGHLKRIRSTREGLVQIIVDSIPKNDSNNLTSNRIENVVEKLLSLSNNQSEYFDGIDINNLHIVQAASTQPRTRYQYDAVSSFWPTTFHPDKNIEKLFAKNSGFSSYEIEMIQENMIRLLEKSRKFNGKPSCLIVDPNVKNKGERNLVCSIGLKEIDPLKHCAMVAIDSIAKLQGGGAYEEPIPENYQEATDINFNGRVRNEHCDYLCTGLDAYLTNEPCLMCAMALLHSRIKRIFFINKSPEFGVLVSILKLHCLPNINHRFQVFNLEFL